ncbi:hypothetical protein B0G62_10469 [Paraburkholderia eburnea]|uniref:Uncharacterized protein n=1 Tax=Paraburkholderia eburnea TaxID=1189126 RepID=A0A2S4MDG2_9BURK|nr:hypothetical protein [Paraburkholderia eburnea]POR52772.1 hypothetical protein B0G62_10469 [Paraburkholderia eburnea]PRZ23640.1 hypothetical protein BX588_10469 [Paraburkholderia eburnea]
MSETTEKLFRTPQDALVFAFNYSMQRGDRPLVDRLAAPAARTGKGLSGNDGAGQAGMIRRFIDGSDSVDYLKGLWDWARTKYKKTEIAQIEEAGDRGLIFLEEERRCSEVYVEFEQLTIVERAAITARFAPRSFICNCTHPCCSGYTPNPEWQKAISDLTQAALTPLSGHLSHYLVRRRLVEEVFGVKVKLELLAEKSSVSKNTITAHRKIIRVWLSGQKAQPAKGAREAQPAIDGVESGARKKIDDLLSSTKFVGAPE